MSILFCRSNDWCRRLCRKWQAVAGINLAHKLAGKGEVIFPRETMIGSMAYYISHAKMRKTSNL